VNSYIFSVVIEEDVFENGEPAYHGRCPVLKGCHTWGHTSDEALTNIREAVQIYVEDMLAAGEVIPVDSQEDVLKRGTPSVVVNV
jgi:predicted RNase H-like HicB family nuclease